MFFKNKKTLKDREDLRIERETPQDDVYVLGEDSVYWADNAEDADRVEEELKED